MRITICKQCFEEFEAKTAQKEYCDKCGAIRKGEARLRHAHSRPKKYIPRQTWGYTLLKDPLKGGEMAKGMQINFETHECMMLHEAYAVGTILSRGGEKNVEIVRGEDGRLIEVEVQE